MSETVFHGRSSDGNNVILSGGSKDLHFTWVFRCAIKGNIYFILELSETLSDTMKKGDTFILRFTGDVETLSGDYVVEMDNNILNEVWVRFEDFMDKKDEEKKDTPQEGNGSSDERKSIVDYNGEGWYRAKNVCYILGIIWGVYSFVCVIFAALPNLSFLAFGSPLMLLVVAIRNAAPENTATAMITSMLSIIFAFLPILSIVNSAIGFKERVRYGNTIHNTAMVIGLITLNPFLLLAGFFNHRDIVLSNKVRPAKKGE